MAIATREKGIGITNLSHLISHAREAAYEARRTDKAAAAEHKRKWKQIHKANRVLYRNRDKSLE